MSDERDAFGRGQDGEGALPRPSAEDTSAPARRRVPGWVVWMVAADIVLVVIVAVVLLA